MIRPKFRELMRRIKTDKWTIRFWFNADAEVFQHIISDAFENSLVLLGHKIKQLPTTPETTPVKDCIENHFGPADGLAACEILSNGTHNGVVLYYEWP